MLHVQQQVSKRQQQAPPCGASPIAQVQQNQAAAPALPREYAAQEYTKLSNPNLVTTAGHLYGWWTTAWHCLLYCVLSSVFLEGARIL